MGLQLGICGHALFSVPAGQFPSLKDSVSYLGSQQSNRAYGVIIAGNRVLDLRRVGVGIYYGNDRDTEPSGLCHCDIFPVYVHYEQDVRQPGHFLDATEELVQALDFVLNRKRLTLGLGLDLTLRHGFFKVNEPLDPSLDGLEVRKHAAQPSLVYVHGASALRLFLDGSLRLLFGADHEACAAPGRHFVDECLGLLKSRQRLRQINDVCAAPLGEDVTVHLRVPSL